MNSDNKIEKGVNTEELNPEELQKLVENNRELLEDISNEVTVITDNLEENKNNKNETEIIVDMNTKNLNELATIKKNYFCELINQIEEKE